MAIERDTHVQHVRTDWAEFLDRVFLSDVVVHLGESGGSVLDLGSGPSISSIIAASRWQKKLSQDLKVLL